MAAVNEYVLVDGFHIENGKIYRPGDKVKLTAEQFAAFGNKFETVTGIRVAKNAPSDSTAG